MRNNHDYDEPPEVSEMREYRVRTRNELLVARKIEREREKERAEQSR